MPGEIVVKQGFDKKAGCVVSVCSAVREAGRTGGHGSHDRVKFCRVLGKEECGKNSYATRV